ncbi:LA2681 family HEPN domain-containing protein [Acinetobacter silvestris]|uniref:LA2681-like HEPN domain-containing protein n=1 Tax=Acinetobacter silvestris TaxID=1977882 RepID=A0A1Y3CHJ2_9GAMM|nr:LA2681 family HEPN domain-containing protein [Acinetobacter silvestris]OTG66586.1 hypothetical protein B9T28_04885 [Acinetobacter silvestris]
MIELGVQQLNALAELADVLLLDGNRKHELIEFFKVHSETQFTFENDLCKGYFYYILGNCSSELYKYQNENWYSQDLINTVNLYQKSVYYLKKSNTERNLLSSGLTNLGNFLSSQGRCFCAQYYWDQAIEIDENPVAIIAKAQSLLFIGNYLYDDSHTRIHYFFANKLAREAMKNLDKLELEQKIPLQENGELYVFNKWFEQNYQNDDFKFVEEYKQKFKTKTEGRYLSWTAENKLFINDLNDVCIEEIVFQDVIGLPSILQKINTSLSFKETLVFHSSFDELRNEYAYARYLIFQASEIKEESSHFYNMTYSHTDDTLHAIDNLKTSHMKSAFRILYSIFDKISYFVVKYLDLPIGDHDISFNKIFGSNKNGIFKPRAELTESNNYFLHALFYILKEIERDSNSQEFFINHEKLRLAKIRNHLEHRSFRIVDDFFYRVNSELDFYNVVKYKELISRKKALDQSNSQNTKEYKDIEASILDKEKKAKYILEMPLSEFYESLMVLVKLVRNALLYLSLAVHFEENKRKGKEDKLVFNRVVPLKK